MEQENLLEKIYNKMNLQIKQIGENEYAMRLGEHVASLINKGLLCKGFCNNQYYCSLDKNNDLYYDLKEKVKNNSIKDKLIWNECKKLKEDYPIISQYCDIVEKIKNLEGRVDDIDTQKRIQEKKERFEKELNNIRTLDKQNGDNISKYEDLRLKQNKIFFYERYYVSKILKQGLFVGSLISDLQEKMKHKGKSTEEINQVLENYVQGFCSNIDFEQISEIFGYDKNYIKRELLNILNNGEKKYSEKLAGYYEGDKKIYDETIYNVNKKYDSFYEKLSNAMIKQLEQQMNKEQASKNDEMNINCDYSRN